MNEIQLSRQITHRTLRAVFGEKACLSPKACWTRCWRNDGDRASTYLTKHLHVTHGSSTSVISVIQPLRVPTDQYRSALATLGMLFHYNPTHVAPKAFLIDNDPLDAEQPTSDRRNVI